MVTAQFFGGLGNQLFQVAAAVSLARQNNDIAAFDFTNWRRSTQGNPPTTYRLGIFRNLLQTNRTEWKIYQDYGVEYRLPPFCPDLQLRGLFQSEKYFPDCRDFLLAALSPSSSTLTKLRNAYCDFLGQGVCAIHVRRGDYLSRGSYCRVLHLDYYRQAIDLFPDYRFLVFSDNISYCKTIFTDPRFSFVEDESDENQLWLMSLCAHQIIANSTFSWWGAWLNQDPSKRIVAPKIWSVRRSRFGTDDIYTNSMIKI